MSTKFSFNPFCIGNEKSKNSSAVVKRNKQIGQTRSAAAYSAPLNEQQEENNEEGFNMQHRNGHMMQFKRANGLNEYDSRMQQKAYHNSGAANPNTHMNLPMSYEGGGMAMAYPTYPLSSLQGGGAAFLPYNGSGATAMNFPGMQPFDANGNATAYTSNGGTMTINSPYEVIFDGQPHLSGGGGVPGAAAGNAFGMPMQYVGAAGPAFMGGAAGVPMAYGGGAALSGMPTQGVGAYGGSHVPMSMVSTAGAMPHMSAGGGGAQMMWNGPTSSNGYPSGAGMINAGDMQVNPNSFVAGAGRGGGYAMPMGKTQNMGANGYGTSGSRVKGGESTNYSYANNSYAR